MTDMTMIDTARKALKDMTPEERHEEYVRRGKLSARKRAYKARGIKGAQTRARNKAAARENPIQAPTMDEEDMDVSMSDYAPTQQLRIVVDQVLYTGTPSELVRIFFCDQWFTSDPTPEAWMKGVAGRCAGTIRTSSPEAFVTDMIWKARLWEPLKREIAIDDYGDPRLAWPVP